MRSAGVAGQGYRCRYGERGSWGAGRPRRWEVREFGIIFEIPKPRNVLVNTNIAVPEKNIISSPQLRSNAHQVLVY